MSSISTWILKPKLIKRNTRTITRHTNMTLIAVRSPLFTPGSNIDWIPAWNIESVKRFTRYRNLQAAQCNYEEKLVRGQNASFLSTSMLRWISPRHFVSPRPLGVGRPQALPKVIAMTSQDDEVMFETTTRFADCYCIYLQKLSPTSFKVVCSAIELLSDFLVVTVLALRYKIVQ